MSAKWLSYMRHVRQRLTLDRRFFKGAGIVVKLYAHYKFGAGKQKFSPGTRRPTIAFFPQPVGPWYNIWLAIQNTKLRIINDPKCADYVFIFDDSTQSKAAQKLPPKNQGILINNRITDISKTNVSVNFKQVFGYDLKVDPTTYIGDVVEKSDENGTHDGKIVTCPIPKNAVKPSCCYQKLIDSSFNGKTHEDLRIVCIYGEIAAVFHKHKAADKRFGTEYLSTEVKNGADVFSMSELDLIAKYCGVIGLDFGAIDVMRDKFDGLIYIVDVNKTCMPVLSLSFEEQYRALTMMGQTLERRLPAL